MSRAREVIPDLVDAIHGVLERHRVTEDEWRHVLAFLTEVGRADEFVLLSDVTRTSVLIDAQMPVVRSIQKWVLTRPAQAPLHARRRPGTSSVLSSSP